MQKNSGNFSLQEALRLANSDAGQRLLALLRSAGGEQLRQASAAGDPAAIQKALEPLIRDPAARKLLRELEERHG